MVDAEIRRLSQEALERARSVLRANRPLVEALAARLLATEVVEEAELVRILGPKVRSARAPEPDEPVDAIGFGA
jgi:cell division protease FtsH